MKAVIKNFAVKVMMIAALVLTSITNTFAAWPELLDKRTNEGPTTSFYVVIFTVIIIGIIIAIATTRESENKAGNLH